MGVMMQAFYWYCPRDEDREFKWWRFVREQVPSLAAAGFTCLWLPPIHKAANLDGPSMGYDVYDYYDLGEFDQKGGIPTWFGTRLELLDLVREAHAHGLILLADTVINHNAGGDEQEENPITGQKRWTKFRPRSGRFPRNWECFIPNRYEERDEIPFGGFPGLSHANPFVREELLKLARWLIEELEFDGFRYDFAKGYPPSTVQAFQSQAYQRGGKPVHPFGVAEYWEPTESIVKWIEEVNSGAANPVAAFDFPLRELLKAICDQAGFSLRNLATVPTLLASKPANAVTFVESHDLRDEGRPITSDKLLAYSFVLTHEGFPSVYWKDYYNLGLALRDTPNGIDALVDVHENYAAGETEVLHLDDDLYIMQRAGSGDRPGLIYVLNNRADDWHGTWATTRWPNAAFRPAAWWSRTELARPINQSTGRDGRGQFFAPPRGFAVYILT